MGEAIQLSTLFSGMGLITLLGWIVWTGPHWKAKINEARKNEDDAQDRLIGRLEATCIRLEQEHKECRREVAELTKRVAQLEGYQLGEGKAAQHYQAIRSAERLEERKQEDE